jgi:hypothetical protein
MAREELKWQNIDADDLPAEVKRSFDAMVEAEAVFKADLEKLLKNEGHMPEDKVLVMSRKGKRLGVAYASTFARWHQCEPQTGRRAIRCRGGNKPSCCYHYHCGGEIRPPEARGAEPSATFDDKSRKH